MCPWRQASHCLDGRPFAKTPGVFPQITSWPPARAWRRAQGRQGTSSGTGGIFAAVAVVVAAVSGGGDGGDGVAAAGRGETAQKEEENYRMEKTTCTGKDRGIQSDSPEKTTSFIRLGRSESCHHDRPLFRAIVGTDDTDDNTSHCRPQPKTAYCYGQPRRRPIALFKAFQRSFIISFIFEAIRKRVLAFIPRAIQAEGVC